MYRIIKAYAPFVAIILIASEPAFAQQTPVSLGYGRLEVHPVFRSSFTYTDNLYQHSQDEREENITETVPGISFRYPTTLHLFRAGYSAKIFALPKQDIQKVKHSASASADLNFPFGLVFRLSESFSQNLYPSLPEEPGVTEHTSNLAFTEVGYRVSKRWDVRARYTYSYIRYQTPEGIEEPFWTPLDRDGHSGGAILLFQLMAKVSLNAELWYGQLLYQEQDYSGYQAVFLRPMVGASSRFSPKANLSVKFGYEHRTFEDEDLPSMSGPVATCSFNHKLNSLFSYEVSASRSVHETLYSNNTHYFSTGGQASFFYRPMGILSMGFDLAYLFLQFPEADPNDNKREEGIMTASPRVKVYPLQWLEVGIGYAFRERREKDPDLNYLDFNENRISASLGAIL